MIKDILTNYRNYVEGRKGAADAYMANSKELEANYIGGVLKSKQEALKMAYKDRVAALEGEYLPPIRNALTGVKAAIRAAAFRPIPDNVQKSLTAFDGLKISDGEKAVILEMTKNSYLARKRAIELLNVKEDEFTPSIDEVLENIDLLENVIDRALERGTDSYDSRLILQGDFVGSIANEVETFMATYDSESD